MGVVVAFPGQPRVGDRREELLGTLDRERDGLSAKPGPEARLSGDMARIAALMSLIDAEEVERMAEETAGDALLVALDLATELLDCLSAEQAELVTMGLVERARRRRAMESLGGEPGEP